MPAGRFWGSRRTRIERSLVRAASDAHHAALFGASLAETIRGREDEVTGYVLRWLASLEGAPSVLEGLEIEGEITARIAAVHERYHALLCPAMGIPALAAGLDHSEHPVAIGDGTWDVQHDVCPTEVFNIASRCPVVCVPAGRDPEGLPIGVQIVGRTYDDATAFRVAAAIERERPWPLVAEGWLAAEEAEAAGSR